MAWMFVASSETSTSSNKKDVRKICLPSVLIALLSILPSLYFPFVFREILNDFVSNKNDFGETVAILCELVSRILVFLSFVVFIESMYTF